MTEVGKIWAINWLRDRHVKTLIIDSWARVLDSAGVDENDNSAVGMVAKQLDNIKAAAGVSTMFVIAHTGRAVQEEGSERARGATKFDDWADVQWVLTRDGTVRFFAVRQGRGVEDRAPTSLTIDEKTRRLTLGGATKVDARTDALVQLVVSLVTEMPRGYSKRSLIRVMRERAPERMRNQNVLNAAVTEAIELGFVRTVPGERNSQMLEPTPVNSDMGSASVRVLDFTKVKDRAERRRKQ
jgi:hypothetical protein